MEKCAQSLSVFPVFALEIWTLRYEPLVSGSSCSLFGCTFLAQCLVRLRIHICVFWCSSLVGRRHVRCCATTGLWSDSGENCGLRSCIPRCGRCPGWQVVQILWCKCEGDSRLPQMQLIRTRFWTRSLTCLRCVTAGAWSSVQKLRILRSCSSSTRCGRPCDHTATSRFSFSSGGASDSVHRQSRGHPVVQQRLVCGVMAAVMGFFDAFCVIFRAPPAMPELSASFSSFRALTAVSARGLHCQLETMVLWTYTLS